MKAKIPPENRITPHELKLIQKRTGLRNEDIGKLVGKSAETISAYRTGRLFIPTDVGEKLSKIESTFVQKVREDGCHVKNATAARIRHLMSDLYPQWRGTDVDGYIFTG